VVAGHLVGAVDGEDAVVEGQVDLLALEPGRSASTTYSPSRSSTVTPASRLPSSMGGTHLGAVTEHRTTADGSVPHRRASQLLKHRFHLLEGVVRSSHNRL